MVPVRNLPFWEHTLFPDPPSLEDCSTCSLPRLRGLLATPAHTASQHPPIREPPSSLSTLYPQVLASQAPPTPNSLKPESPGSGSSCAGAWPPSTWGCFPSFWDLGHCCCPVSTLHRSPALAHQERPEDPGAAFPAHAWWLSRLVAGGDSLEKSRTLQSHRYRCPPGAWARV